MRINDNTSGVTSISITPRDKGRANKPAPEIVEGDSVVLGFAAQYAEAQREPGAIEKALTLASRDGSYDPHPQQIASALMGKAFEQ